MYQIIKAIEMKTFLNVSGSSYRKVLNKRASSGKNALQCNCSALVFFASRLFFKVLDQDQNKLSVKLIE